MNKRKCRGVIEWCCNDHAICYLQDTGAHTKARRLARNRMYLKTRTGGPPK